MYYCFYRLYKEEFPKGDEKSKRKKEKERKKKKKDKKSKKKKKKKGETKKKKGNKKKEKMIKDKDSPKRKDDSRKEPDKVKVNIVRPGGQERDKFGFYIAPQALQALKEKTPEKKRTPTPEKRERRRSHSGGRRDKDRRRDSPKRGGSRDRDRRQRDSSAGRADRRSPGRGGRSPRGRSPVGRQRSAGRRERSSGRGNKSPAGRRGGSRASSRDKDRQRDGGRDRSRDRDTGKDSRKDDLKEDLRNTINRDAERRREEERRKENRERSPLERVDRKSRRGDDDKRDDHRGKDDRNNDRRDREDRASLRDDRSADSRLGPRGDKGKKGDWDDRDDDRRKKDDDDDVDLKRGPNWNRRDDSPRRGRAGRGRKRRGDRRGDSSGRQGSIGKGRQRRGAADLKSRSVSRNRAESLDKSGSIELRLDTSRELLNSPRKLATEPSKDNVDREKEDKRASKDENEDLAEDFSDFGDSDDEILNQEESDSREGGELRDTDSRPSSRLSQKKDGDLGEFDRDDTNTTSANESEENIKTNARLADALGADWSQLLHKEKPRAAETGDARKRWSLPEIIKRVGLSQKMIGGVEEYNKFLANLNKDLPEEEKVVLLDTRPWRHVSMVRKLEQEKSLFSDLGGCRALSARADINIRRKLNGIRAEDTGLPVARVNTNMELYKQARTLLDRKMKMIQESRDRVMASIAAGKA